MDIPIALGWLFTNGLMAKFNMKGKGKKDKKPLEKNHVYKAIQDMGMVYDSKLPIAP